MRTALLILSSVALLAACADKDPTSPNAAAPSLAQADWPPGPSVKPVDEVGWTKADTYYSNIVDIPIGSSASALVTCPAGTTATGGGYGFAGVPATLVIPPLVWYAGPDNTGTGWSVSVQNFAGSGGTMNVRAYIRCAS